MSTSSNSPPTSSVPPTPAGAPDAVPRLADDVLLVWTPGGLPFGVDERIAALGGVSAVTAVASDTVHIVATHDETGAPIDTTEPGFVIPVEGFAIDLDTYLALMPPDTAALLRSLRESEVVLGTTSAEVRDLGPGATITIEGGATVTVAGIVDDVLVGGAEVIAAADSTLGQVITTDRYLLVRFGGDRIDIEAAIRDVIGSDVATRIRGPGETPIFRHGDAVQPQSVIKLRFGEFSYRPAGGRSFEIDPQWVAEYIVEATVPLLGDVVCHRSFLPVLSDAMADLQMRGLGHLVDPDAFAGCWNPRYIGGGRLLSRHAWGVAADINFANSPTGLASPQDPRLLDTLLSHGLTSGHDWLIPDPGHFEYLRPSDR